MWALSQRNSEAVARAVRKCCPRAINAGASVKVVDDNVVMLEDLEEWLWTDYHALVARTGLHLATNVYYRPGDNRDRVDSLTVVVTVLTDSWLSWAATAALRAVSCVLVVTWFLHSYMPQRAR